MRRPVVGVLIVHIMSHHVMLGLDRDKRKLDWTRVCPKGLPLGVQTSRRTSGFRGYCGSVDSIVRRRLREFWGKGFNDLGIFEVVSSRSKLEEKYRQYDGLYKKGISCTDQVTPTLIEGTHHRRTRENMMETMSKRNYVISARELIGGDRSPRR